MTRSVKLDQNGVPLHPHSGSTREINSKLFGSSEDIPMLFPFNRVSEGWYQLMRPDEAAVLAFLWGLRDMAEAQRRLRPGEWFFCKVRTLEQHLNIKESVQRRILASLEGKRFIQQKKFGQPAKRHVRIARKRIIRRMEKRWQELYQYNEKELSGTW